MASSGTYKTARSTSPPRATASPARRSRPWCSPPPSARASTRTGRPTCRSRCSCDVPATGRHHGTSRPTTTATAARDPHQGDARLGQLRLRAARLDVGPEDGARDREADGHHHEARRPTRPRAWAACAEACRRSRWPRLRDARRQAGCATSRRRSTRVVFPDGKTDDLGEPEAQARVLRRRRVRGDQDPRAERPGGHRHGGRIRLPGRRQDRDHRQLQRRLVRRLHAASSPPRSGSAIPTPCVEMRSVHGISVAGGTFPAPSGTTT